MSATEQDAALCDRNADSCRDSQYPEERGFEAIWRERAAQIRTQIKGAFFSESEIKSMSENPVVLRALADQHDVWATMADGADYRECVPHHDARRKALLEAAAKIEADI